MWAAGALRGSPASTTITDRRWRPSWIAAASPAAEPPTYVLVSSRTVSLSVPVPSRRGSLKFLFAALLGAAVAAVIVLSVTGQEAPAQPKPVVFQGKGFALAAPKGWTSKAQNGNGLALERTGRGVVVVKTTPAPKDQSLDKLTKGLTTELAKRFSDFKFVSAKVQKLRGGQAYLFTFVRTKQGTAQSIALVKLGATNYTIDTVTKSDDQAAAMEAAAIVRSFGP